MGAVILRARTQAWREELRLALRSIDFISLNHYGPLALEPESAVR